MHLTLPTKPFLAALQAAAGVVPSRTPKDILKSVKLSVGKSVTIIASDGEVSLRQLVDEHDVTSPGDVLLPPQRLIAILREADAKDVSLQLADGKLTCKAGRNRFDLQTSDPAEFPDVPPFDGKDVVTCQASDLQRTIARTVFACDAESTRYALGGILFEGKDKIAIAATDSRRLAVETFDAKGTITGRPVVPSRAARLIAQVASGDVRMAFDANSLAVQTGDSTIRARLVEGRFPKYQDVIPRDFQHTVDMVVAPLLSAVRQSMIVTNEESRGVDFCFGDGTLRLQSTGAEIGTSNVSMSIQSDANITVTLDPRFVAEWLKTREPGDLVAVNLNGTGDSLLWESGTSRYVVMPLAKKE